MPRPSKFQNITQLEKLTKAISDSKKPVRHVVKRSKYGGFLTTAYTRPDAKYIPPYSPNMRSNKKVKITLPKMPWDNEGK